MLSQYLSRIPPYETTQFYILIGFCSVVGAEVTFDGSNDFVSSVKTITEGDLTVYESKDVVWIARATRVEKIDYASFVRQELFKVCVEYLESKGVHVNYRVLYKIHGVEELRLDTVVINHVEFNCTLISRALADYIMYIRSARVLNAYDTTTRNFIIEMLQ